jgi:hypothetical protein
VTVVGLRSNGYGVSTSRTVADTKAICSNSNSITIIITIAITITITTTVPLKLLRTLDQTSLRVATAEQQRYVNGLNHHA